MAMKKILFICKVKLDKAVPIINIAQALNAEGNEIEIICSKISDGLENTLEKSGIKILSIGLDEPNSHNILFLAFLKLQYWLTFRSKVKKILSQKSVEILYIATADTAIALRGILNRYKYILHLRELHDRQPHYMKLIKKPAKQAYKVVVPEINRAYLYFNYLNLRELPIVIPNKPFYHPMKLKMDICFLNKELQRRINSKKNIIYQGPIAPERDLTELIKASKMLHEYNLILMGQDAGMLDKYLKINPNIIHISFLSPPLHLNVTSWAYIGVITYGFNSLNTIYCAPNKVWEFTGFNIPILGNLNPGIRYTIGHARAGVIVDFENYKEILYGILEIEKNYDNFQTNANLFYNSYNADRINELILQPKCEKAYVSF
jgi:hypothetical protein